MVITRGKFSYFFLCSATRRTKERNKKWESRARSKQVLGQTVINRDAGTWVSGNGKYRNDASRGLFDTQEPQKGRLVCRRNASYKTTSKIWVSANIEVKVAIFVTTRQQNLLRTLFSFLSCFFLSFPKREERLPF